MKTHNALFRTAVIIFVCLFLFACRAGLALVKGKNWLDAQTNKPEINVSGKWDSNEWGEGRFKQDGRQVTGVLGDYPVKGVVSGRSLYLLMYSGDRVDYSAHLTASDNKILSGFYSKYYIVDEVKDDPADRGQTRPIHLEKRLESP